MANDERNELIKKALEEQDKSGKPAMTTILEQWRQDAEMRQRLGSVFNSTSKDSK